MLNAPTTTKTQLFQRLNESASGGTLVLNGDGQVLSINQTGGALFGYKVEELFEEGVGLFWKDAPQLMPSTPTTIAEAELTEKNGRRFPAQIIISPMTTSDKTHHTVLTITPTNEQDHLDQALAYTQRLSGLGTLTASIAHELNTPVSIITATCSNLKHEMETNELEREQLMRYVDMIEQSAWRSARILEVLRNYSYNDRPQFDVTNLNMIVEDAVTLVRHQFRGQYNIKIEQELDDNMPSFVCDHHRMTQVLLNLLINASDAIPEKGGVVKIRTWIQQEEGKNATCKPKTLYCLSVQDSGTGIDEKIQNDIFKPFFTTKPFGKGTGLGLYIAKEIVDLHHGDITFGNNEEGGANFTVRLPRNLRVADD